VQKLGLMKKFLCLFFFLLAHFAFSSQPSFSEPKSISVQNTILAKVKERTISVLDVRKKMDLIFYKSYPNLKNNVQARYQFYLANWRHFLTEMIDTELILADAATKELKITDGEIREEMQKRFGPNILFTLYDMGLTYEETWQMVKTEIIVRKMTGYHVSGRVYSSVTPVLVRQAYEDFCSKNPELEEWNYQLVTVKAPDESLQKQVADQVHALLVSSKKDPSSLQGQVKEIEKKHQGAVIQISQLYKANQKELSKTHLSILQSLSSGSYSDPIFQTSRLEGKKVTRIFYLKDANKKEIPSFEKMSDQLQEQLFHEMASKEYSHFCEKLRKRYGYDPIEELKNFDESFQPFLLQ
jgi:hypothetical protein